MTTELKHLKTKFQKEITADGALEHGSAGDGPQARCPGSPGPGRAQIRQRGRRPAGSEGRVRGLQEAVCPLSGAGNPERLGQSRFGQGAIR